jgi:uncharacterized protein (DUF1800 family)
MANVHGRCAGFRALLVGFLVATLAVPAPPVLADAPAAKVAASKAVFGRLPVRDLSEDEAILHALNRLGFGPRPGDVERIRRLGLEKWVEQQLKPEAMDDSALARRLERYPTLAMSSARLLEEFPNPAQAAARMGLTPEEYRKQLEEQGRRAQMNLRQWMGDAPDPGMPGARGRPGRGEAMPEPRLEEIRAPQRIILELSMAKLTRAIYSERQLEEVMADFWFNHFNVFAGKGADRWLLTSYERDAIRPHALGKFRDLLGATAKSPAMLFYLDNWMSADPKASERMEQEFRQRRERLLGRFGGRDPRMTGGMVRGRLGQRMPPPGQIGQRPPPGQPAPAAQRMRRGLNENYARELMELHTLGVDGGYAQQDVVEVARCFTGWTLEAPRRNPEFLFDERLHDRDAKTVLGRKITAGGRKDGEQVLDLLARHPSTAKHIATKLARRFVSDDPPAALVARLAKTFTETDGDIRAVLRTLFYAPEFWSRDAYRAKIKKPFELVASAARALGAEADVPLGLVMWTGRIGEPLYQCPPPTGYADTAEAWVNTGALLNRLNFSLALAGNRIRGTRVAAAALAAGDAADASHVLARAIELFLAGQVSEGTRATLEKQLSDPSRLAGLDDPVRQVDAGVIAGLVLGAPEFQRR